MEAGHNSDVIELSDDRFVVLRHAQSQPARAMELADVRDEIAAIIMEAVCPRIWLLRRRNGSVQALAAGEAIEQLATRGWL